jgi:hypothetical protein
MYDGSGTINVQSNAGSTEPAVVDIGVIVAGSEEDIVGRVVAEVAVFDHYRVTVQRRAGMQPVLAAGHRQKTQRHPVGVDQFHAVAPCRRIRAIQDRLVSGVHGPLNLDTGIGRRDEQI